MNTTLLLRWTARILSVALAAVFVAFTIGEGPPPFWPLSLHTFSSCLLAACLAGLLLAWRWEAPGALLALISVAGFYLVDFAASGLQRFPDGWVFPLLLVTPLLYLLAWSRSDVPRAPARSTCKTA